jgi:glycine/D-amino acid oxidase-like deaminating enzyme
VEAQDIVIVGAGSAGLATAALLRQLASIRSCLRQAPSMALPGGAGMGRLAPPVGADRGGAAIPLHDSNPAVYIADVVEHRRLPDRLLCSLCATCVPIWS